MGDTAEQRLAAMGIDLPSPWLLPAAVGVQVLFVLGQAYYLLMAHPANAYGA